MFQVQELPLLNDISCYLCGLDISSIIYLNELPKNVIEIYLNSLNEERDIEYSVPSVNIEHFVDGKNASHMRVLYKTLTHFYKLINFKISVLPHFMELVKYDEVFEIAVKLNFYDNITMVNRFIVDDKYTRIIGYECPIMNPINAFDVNKYYDLINRLIKQFCNTGIIYTDLIPQNIMEYDDKYYIIDLETVTTLDVYKQDYIRHKHFSTNCKIYENILFQLNCQYPQNYESSTT